MKYEHKDDNVMLYNIDPSGNIFINTTGVRDKLRDLNDEIKELKEQKAEAIKYIDKILTTDTKVDLDAVLITVKSILGRR